MCIRDSAVPAPDSRPPPGCVVDAVPADAALTPRELGELTLLGARLETTQLSERRGIWLESWWQLQRPTERDRLLDTRVTYERPSDETTWGADHEPCDWGWPTSRWVEGAIYYDRYLLRPRPTLPDGTYTVTLAGVEVGAVEVER